MIRTTIRDYHGILLAEWVSTGHLTGKERKVIAQDIGGAVEYTIPRPDQKRQPVKNTVWKGQSQ